MATPFQILGLKPGASIAAVKRAHRRLALQHHPDRNGGGDRANDRMAEINAARDQALTAIAEKKKQRQQKRVQHVDVGAALSSRRRYSTPSSPFEALGNLFVDLMAGYAGVDSGEMDEMLRQKEANERRARRKKQG